VATRRAVSLPLVEPIVPVLRAPAFNDPAYLFEPKYDGFRVLLYVTRAGWHFQ
jgi:ATP-dependent DNA ligase